MSAVSQARLEELCEYVRGLLAENHSEAGWFLGGERDNQIVWLGHDDSTPEAILITLQPLSLEVVQ